MCSFFRFFSVALNEKNVTNFEIGLNKPLDCSEDCGQGGICLVEVHLILLLEGAVKFKYSTIINVENNFQYLIWSMKCPI